MRANNDSFSPEYILRSAAAQSSCSPFSSSSSSSFCRFLFSSSASFRLCLLYAQSCTTADSMADVEALPAMAVLAAGVSGTTGGAGVEAGVDSPSRTDGAMRRGVAMGCCGAEGVLRRAACLRCGGAASWSPRLRAGEKVSCTRRQGGQETGSRNGSERVRHWCRRAGGRRRPVGHCQCERTTRDGGLRWWRPRLGVIANNISGDIANKQRGVIVNNMASSPTRQRYNTLGAL